MSKCIRGDYSLSEGMFISHLLPEGMFISHLLPEGMFISHHIRCSWLA
jgi:hypothetical protein